MLLSALTIKMLGVYVSAYFLRRGWKEINDTHHHHVGTSHLTSPLVLLVWRVAMFAFTAGVLYVQISERGPRAFRFFTVWNWTAIIVYFLLASIASASVVFGGRGDVSSEQMARRSSSATSSGSRRMTRSMTGSSKGSSKMRVDAPKSTALSKAVATAFHVLTPMTLYVLMFNV